MGVSLHEEPQKVVAAEPNNKQASQPRREKENNYVSQQKSSKIANNSNPENPGEDISQKNGEDKQNSSLNTAKSKSKLLEMINVPEESPSKEIFTEV